jgi:hypothetical protein
MNRTELLDLCRAAGALGALHSCPSQAAKALANDLTDLLILEVAGSMSEDDRKKVMEMRKNKHEARVKTRMEQEGPLLWAKIHTRAINWGGVDPVREIEWLGKELPLSLPCGECKRHYLEFLAGNPPDLSLDGYFRWTVDLHNHVNRLKEPKAPELSLEEAYKIWKK